VPPPGEEEEEEEKQQQQPPQQGVASCLVPRLCCRLPPSGSPPACILDILPAKASPALCMPQR